MNSIPLSQFDFSQLNSQSSGVESAANFLFSTSTQTIQKLIDCDEHSPTESQNCAKSWKKQVLSTYLRDSQTPSPNENACFLQPTKLTDWIKSEHPGQADLHNYYEVKNPPSLKRALGERSKNLGDVHEPSKPKVAKIRLTRSVSRSKQIKTQAEIPKVSIKSSRSSVQSGKVLERISQQITRKSAPATSNVILNQVKSFNNNNKSKSTQSNLVKFNDATQPQPRIPHPKPSRQRIPIVKEEFKEVYNESEEDKKLDLRTRNMIAARKLRQKNKLLKRAQEQEYSAEVERGNTLHGRFVSIQSEIAQLKTKLKEKGVEIPKYRQ